MPEQSAEQIQSSPSPILRRRLHALAGRMAFGCDVLQRILQRHSDFVIGRLKLRRVARFLADVRKDLTVLDRTRLDAELTERITAVSEQMKPLEELFNDLDPDADNVHITAEVFSPLSNRIGRLTSICNTRIKLGLVEPGVPYQEIPDLEGTFGDLMVDPRGGNLDFRPVLEQLADEEIELDAISTGDDVKPQGENKAPIPDVPPIVDSSQWCSPADVAKIEGSSRPSRDSLGDYRRRHDAYLAPDSMSGQDPYGRQWRRRGKTKKSYVCYFIPSLRPQEPDQEPDS